MSLLDLGFARVKYYLSLDLYTIRYLEFVLDIFIYLFFKFVILSSY